MRKVYISAALTPIVSQKCSAFFTEHPRYARNTPRASNGRRFHGTCCLTITIDDGRGKVLSESMSVYGVYWILQTVCYSY